MRPQWPFGEGNISTSSTAPKNDGFENKLTTPRSFRRVTNLLKGILLCLFSAGTLAGQMENGTSWDIWVLGVPVTEQKKFNNTYRVDGNGMMRFPLVGELKASGLTTTRFAKVLEASLKGVKGYEKVAVVVVEPPRSSVPRFSSLSGPMLAQYIERGKTFEEGRFSTGISVFGDVQKAETLFGSRGITLADLLEKAMGGGYWPCLEVWVIRESRMYCLRPLPSAKFRKEKVFSCDVIGVRRLKPWDWFKPNPYRKKVFAFGEFIQ